MSTMTKKQTFRVTVDGREYTRTSSAKYTHVVIRSPGNGDVVAWSGSEANATKAMRQWQGWWPAVRFEVRAIEDLQDPTTWQEGEDGSVTITGL